MASGFQISTLPALRQIKGGLLATGRRDLSDRGIHANLRLQLPTISEIWGRLFGSKRPKTLPDHPMGLGQCIEQPTSEGPSALAQNLRFRYDRALIAIGHAD
jgi:hypothetical protein